ncbi:hypothetical protein BWK57_12405 [Flavobacterium columnare]|uniref:hypothetical protein n=1 Tax=Flavobacterium columnare TaxID=996 RepID=UPI000CDAEAC1|nr:hypothetical protein [Flavobacterium columnare]POR20780.1 hypothetical protein BWK57_12405 [Flavobacterium columnare]
MYFKDCKNFDEAKNLFKNLCKKLHPDTSGYNSESDFTKMYSEFESLKKEGKDANFSTNNFYNLLKKFDSLNNINISFVGSFIWLEDIEKGALYFHKEIIKSIEIEGYNLARFAPKKKAWYFYPLDYKTKSFKSISIEDIKNKYGCDTYSKKNKLIK